MSKNSYQLNASPRTEISCGVRLETVPEAHSPQLTRFRNFAQSSLAFSARLQDGKVVTQGSYVGQDIADQLNQLPKRFRPDAVYAGKDQGLRMLDDKYNVFHLQSTPAAAVVLKSSCPASFELLPASNPGRAHLGLVSGVQTTAAGDQFRLVDQRIYRFEPQIHGWLPDQDDGDYRRLGLAPDGSLLKVPAQVADLSVEGHTQVCLESLPDGCLLRISRGASAPETRVIPVSESGEPVQLSRVALSGDALYASMPQGELLCADLRDGKDGRLTLRPVPVDRLESLHGGPVSIKGFMHDDNGRINALALDSRDQLHSSPLNDGPLQATGWNLSDVLLKVSDKGVPAPGLRALASAVDLGPRGKVALEGSTLLSWDVHTQDWSRTQHQNVKRLEHGLDGRAYVLQDCQLKALATHKPRGVAHSDASYDLTPVTMARTHVTLDGMSDTAAGRKITAFAVENARRFVTLDHDNQLHVHLDGTETTLKFSHPQALKALALDRLGGLYAQSDTGRLLKLQKADWQATAGSEVTWTPVALPGDAPLKSLRMGAGQQLIVSWGDNTPGQKNYGERYRQLTISTQGVPQWQAIAPSPTTGAASLGTVLGRGEFKSQDNGTAWAVTSAFICQKSEGLGSDRGFFKGIAAHINPGEGLKNIGLDVQHRFKGRAGLAGLYANDRALRGQLDKLAKTPPATVDMATRLERLKVQKSTQALAITLMESVALIEANSQPLAVRLGDLKGAGVTPLRASSGPENTLNGASGSLGQMRQAFENLAPSAGNHTAALLRSYEHQGVSLSTWRPEQKRDLDNPTALVESDLIQHARTLSRLGVLITRLEGDAPDQAKIAGALDRVMQDYRQSPVHKKASQNINSHAQAEALYKNFKLLAKDLGTPGSALNFHLARTLGLSKEGSVKQALAQQIQQSDSGQSIAATRSKTKSAVLFGTGISPVPLLEIQLGVSRAKSNGVTISRTDQGANVEISMGTSHAFNASLGSGATLFPAGEAAGTGVRVGAEASVAVGRDTGASVSFDVKEADFPEMMAILAGEKGDVFDLLDLGSHHQSGQRSKTSFDLSLSAFVQGRAHCQVAENSNALGFLMRSAIGGAASLNLAHLDRSRTVTQGASEITRTQGNNRQLLAKGGASVGLGPLITVASGTVGADGSTLAGFTGSDIALTVSFDRSRSHAMRFTFKQPDVIQQGQVDDLRADLAKHSAHLKQQLQARGPATGEPGEQLQLLQRMFDKAPAPVHRSEEHHALKNRLQKCIHQQALAGQGKRELSSVESTVSYVGLNADAQHEWLNDVAPANKAAILKLFADLPQLAGTLKDLESNKGTSVSIGLEVKPEVLRMIEDRVGDGRKADHDVQQALKNLDNLRVKTLSVSYTASRSHSVTLPTPVLSFASSAGLSHTHKILNTELEYGRDPDVPLRMKFKDSVAAAQNRVLHPEQIDHRVRDHRNPLS